MNTIRPGIDELIFDERQNRTHARRKVLEPILAKFANVAENAYETLRPEAKHVGTVKRDYPLRHQQVYGAGEGNIDGIVADYLMIAFGGHHDLVLYRNFTDGRRYRWQFTRSLLLDDLLQEQTRVETLTSARSVKNGGGVMEIEVATYRYSTNVGMNGKYVGRVCDCNNDFDQAESYIEAFRGDIVTAVSRLALGTEKRREG